MSIKNQDNPYTILELQNVMRGLGRERIIAALINPDAPHLVNTSLVKNEDFIDALMVTFSLGENLENLGLPKQVFTGEIIDIIKDGLLYPSQISLIKPDMDKVASILDEVIFQDITLLSSRLNEPLWPYIDQDTRFRLWLARQWLDQDNKNIYQSWKSSYYRDSLLSGIQKIIESNFISTTEKSQWYPEKTVNSFFSLVVKPHQILGEWFNGEQYHIISCLQHGLTHDCVLDISQVSSHLYRGLSFPCLDDYEMPKMDAKIEYDILSKWLEWIKKPTVAKKDVSIMEACDIQWDE